MLLSRLCPDCLFIKQITIKQQVIPIRQAPTSD